ncbi:hypothetical protein L1987_33936 [Smallanthus sonchifolius]|uniref:Uncharacterized protein n=1 Tax=Smallanthus sonchifolius TaxID=185202 RepID=A0ACB9HT82_9ASTR|nr:hypothetical protein L1987_33936 [Smallanthus sonchifolius]
MLLKAESCYCFWYIFLHKIKSLYMLLVVSCRGFPTIPRLDPSNRKLVTVGMSDSPLALLLCMTHVAHDGKDVVALVTSVEVPVNGSKTEG